MKTNMKFRNNFEILSEINGKNTKFEVIQWSDLKGGESVNSAMMTYFMRESDIKMKALRVRLDNSSVKLEAGALHYMKGDIEMTSKMGGLKGLGKKMFNSALTKETVMKPLYEGTGEIYTEPTFGHFALIELENEEIIVDDGIFYASEGNIEVGASMQKNMSSALLGNEGLFQTKIKGSGIVALEIPVPECEIVKFTLNNETLKVDGNIALLRTGNVQFTVEKSTKSLIGSAASGEGFLNVFRGTGEVWVAPTQAIYDRLAYSGLSGMTNPGGSSNTRS